MKRLDTSRLSRPRLCVQSLAPAFGDNYKPGYIGFTHTGSSQLSTGIAWFTRWSRLSDIHVSHVLVVTGNNECVEALGGKGIVKSPLNKYFDDPKTQIFFRRPRKCTAAVGQRIAETALAQVGTKYDDLLIAAQMLEASFLRRWMMSHFHNTPSHFVGRLLNRDIRWICSELASYCLDCQPEYADKGVLVKPDYAIDPQELFEDQEIFANWHSEPEEGPKSSAARLA
ncbi:MAG: hypothetical protein D4R65_07930 [Verrucomicrobiaceae bacterium]|nr:MAG: hypothetical protein D4R65_07930 [Verrucomicrobiaceae bacterium]